MKDSVARHEIEEIKMAIKKLCGRSVDYTLCMLGEGSLLEKITAIADHLGVDLVDLPSRVSVVRKPKGLT